MNQKVENESKIFSCLGFTKTHRKTKERGEKYPGHVTMLKWIKIHQMYLTIQTLLHELVDSIIYDAALQEMKKKRIF